MVDRDLVSRTHSPPWESVSHLDAERPDSNDIERPQSHNRPINDRRIAVAQDGLHRRTMVRGEARSGLWPPLSPFTLTTTGLIDVAAVSARREHDCKPEEGSESTLEPAPSQLVLDTLSRERRCGARGLQGLVRR